MEFILIITFRNPKPKQKEEEAKKSKWSEIFRLILKEDDSVLKQSINILSSDLSPEQKKTYYEKIKFGKEETPPKGRFHNINKST